MSPSATTFRAWCIEYGCRWSLYIGSLDFQHHRAPWNPTQQWNGSDLAGSYLAEFGYIGTGNPWALPPGADPVLLSKGTTASNHETGQMAQRALQALLGPAPFGLPADYRFTLADGQRAVVLEDPKTPGVCLWDGLLARMLHEQGSQKPPAPPGPPIVPPPVVTPPPTPIGPPAPSQSLPPLTPALQRVEELRRRYWRFVQSLFGAGPAAAYDLLMLPTKDLWWPIFRPYAIQLLKLWRLGDPRLIPPEDL